MKKRIFSLLIVCLLINLACALPFLDNNAPAQHDPALSPVDANTGVRVYHVVPESVSCNLGTEEKDEARTVTFSAGHVEISNANKDGSTTYDEIGDNMYHRITDTGRPIVLSFSSTGFMMEIFEAEGANDSACGYYTFTLKE